MKFDKFVENSVNILLGVSLLAMTFAVSMAGLAIARFVILEVLK